MFPPFVGHVERTSKREAVASPDQFGRDKSGPALSTEATMIARTAGATKVTCAGHKINRVRCSIECPLWVIFDRD